MSKFANRPEDAETLILERVAQAVAPTDTLLCLGDLVYSRNAEFRGLIAPHIPGRKKLIEGNHDGARPSFYRKCGFQVIRPFMVRWGEWDVSFSHYPWSLKDDGSEQPPENHLRIHGHTHAKGYTRSAFVPFLKNHVNVSVEQTDYAPVNLALLLSAVIDGRYPVAEELPDIESVRKENPHVG